MAPDRNAGSVEATARMAKAEEFADAASLFSSDATGSVDLADAYVTPAVHSGIAAADAICIRVLGRYSPTGTHAETVALLARADRSAATALSRLLAVKSKAGYSTNQVSASEVTESRRAHLKLVEVARAAMAAGM